MYRFIHSEWASFLDKYRSTFDHTITDPPYSPHVHAKMTTNSGPGRIKAVDCGFAPLVDVDTLVARTMSRTARWGVFFCALDQLAGYRTSADSNAVAYVRDGIYHKTRATPQLTGDRPGANCEGLAIMHGTAKKRWNGGGTHAYWPDAPVNRKDSGHPTAKPLNLCLRLVELFTDEGDTVFDPFAGVGTIGTACALLGRHYVGTEIEEKYVILANEHTLRAIADRSRLMDRFAEYKEKHRMLPAREKRL